MQDQFIYSYYNNQHYLKLGIYFLLTLLTLCYFIPGLGDFKNFFLFFLLFIVLIIIEFVNYHQIMTEFKKNVTVDKVMKLVKVKTIENKKATIGLLLTGLVDEKVTELKLYRMDPNLEKKIDIIIKYKRLSVTYYPKSKVVKEFHGLTN